MPPQLAASSVDLDLFEREPQLCGALLSVLSAKLNFPLLEFN